MTPICINSDHRLRYKLVYIYVYIYKKKMKRNDTQFSSHYTYKCLERCPDLIKHTKNMISFFVTQKNRKKRNR